MRCLFWVPCIQYISFDNRVLYAHHSLLYQYCICSNIECRLIIGYSSVVLTVHGHEYIIYNHIYFAKVKHIYTTRKQTLPNISDTEQVNDSRIVTHQINREQAVKVLDIFAKAIVNLLVGHVLISEVLLKLQHHPGSTSLPTIYNCEYSIQSKRLSCKVILKEATT